MRFVLKILTAALILLGARSASASPPSFTAGPTLEWTTNHSATWSFESDQYIKIRFDYGPTTAYSSTWTNPDSRYAGHLTLVELTSHSAYHARLCPINASGETGACSGDFAVTTLQSDVNAATLPHSQVDAAPPSVANGRLDGRVTRVDCPALAPAYAAAAWGDTIEVSGKCSGTWKLGGLRSGLPNPAGQWILIQSAGSSPTVTTYPGRSSSGMASLINDEPVIRTDTTTTPQSCRGGSMTWDTTSSTFALKQCQFDGSDVAITGGTWLSPTVVRVAVTSHAFVDGQQIWITGATDDGKDGPYGLAGQLNGSGQIVAHTVGTLDVDTNAVGLRAVYGAPIGSYMGGGRIRGLAWNLAPAYTSGPLAPAAPCTDGDIYFKTGGVTPADARDSVYVCVKESAGAKWWHYRINADVNDFTPALDLRGGTAYTWFRNLEITNTPSPSNDIELLRQANYYPLKTYTQTHWSMFQKNLVEMDDFSDHVVFEGCWIHGAPFPSRTNMGVHFNGAQVALLHNRIDDISVWLDPTVGAWWNSDIYPAAVITTTGPGPQLAAGNFIEAYGLGFHSDDGNMLGPVAADVTWSENYFERQTSMLYSQPGNDGWWRQCRQVFEMKRGVRFLVEGNYFPRQWQWQGTQGSVFALSPRQEGNAGVYCYASNATCSTSRPHYRQGGDRIMIGHTVYTVMSVGSATAFTVDKALAGGGFVFPLSLSPLADGVADITIRNNLVGRTPSFVGAPGQIANFGYSNGGGLALVPPLQRVVVVNNVVQSLDATLTADLGPANGYAFLSDLAAEGFTFAHNTIAGVTGSSGALYGTALGWPVAHELVVRDNLMRGIQWAQGPDQHPLDHLASLQSAFGTYTWAKNVVAFPAPSAGNPPAMTLWRDTAMSGEIPVRSTASPLDYSLVADYRSTDTCYAVPGDCTTDGKDSGADWALLSRALAWYLAAKPGVGGDDAAEAGVDGAAGAGGADARQADGTPDGISGADSGGHAGVGCGCEVGEDASKSQEWVLLLAAPGSALSCAARRGSSRRFPEPATGP